MACVLATAPAGVRAIVPAAVIVPGSFALAGVPRASDATLRYRANAGNAVALEIALRAHGRPLRAFDVEMTKRMHLIAIDRDFSSFVHVHPRVDPGGTFSIDLAVPHPGRYVVYADTTPHGIGQQVFRFDVSIGTKRNAAYAPPPTDSHATTSRNGAYTVRLDSLALRAGRESRIGITISKGGTLATDLRSYLGGAAHAVFIETKTLEYLHVHPSAERDAHARTGMEAMDAMAGMHDMRDMMPLASDAHVDGKLALHVNAPHPGRYKLWLQYRGVDGLHVAPFTLVAR